MSLALSDVYVNFYARLFTQPIRGERSKTRSHDVSSVDTQDFLSPKRERVDPTEMHSNLGSSDVH